MKVTRFLAGALSILLFFGGLCIVGGLAELFSTYKYSKEYSVEYAYFVRGEEYQKPVYTRPAAHKSYYFVYTYCVDGKDYEIKKDFGANDFPPPGSFRMVYYDPANPQTAVLDSSDYAKKSIERGAVLVFAAFVLLIFVIRRKGGIEEIKTYIFGG